MATAAVPGTSVVLPNHLQLPETDGTFVQNFLEHPQSILLTDAIEPVLQQLHPDGHYAIGQDCGIYWWHTEPPERGVKAPDWFYVPGVPPMLEGQYRRSYVMWQEIVSPLLLLEFVSGDGHEERDQTPRIGKFWVYEQAVRAGYYGIYEVDPGQLMLFQLVAGRFRSMPPNERGHFPIEAMGVELGIWQGWYLNQELPWLRFFDAAGNLLPTGHERAEAERRRAEDARQRAEAERRRAEEEHLRAEEAEQLRVQEHARAERLAARLRELGIDPEKD